MLANMMTEFRDISVYGRRMCCFRRTWLGTI